MNINLVEPLQEAVQRALPWDLTLTLPEGEFKTKAPTVADLALLARGDNVGMEDLHAVLERLFEEPRPDVRAWSGEQIGAVLAAITAYFGEHLRKNSQGLTKRVATLVKKAMGSGNS